MTAETQPELLAHHYRHSDSAAHAIPYLQRAARQAAEQAAYEDAITHLTTALELLATLPDTPERTRQELALRGKNEIILRCFDVIHQALPRIYG